MEFMIIFIGGRWYLVEESQIQMTIEHSIDEARTSRLKSSFKQPTKVEHDKLIERFKSYVEFINDNNSVYVQADVMSVETNWLILKVVHVDDKLVRKNGYVSNLEIPSMSILVFKIKSDGKELTISFLFTNVTSKFVCTGNSCSKTILIFDALLPFMSCEIPKLIPPGPATINFWLSLLYEFKPYLLI